MEMGNGEFRHPLRTMAKPDEYQVTKKAHAKATYQTEEDVLDLIRCVDDPLFFCENFVKVQHPLKGMLPFEPYDFQKRMIEAFKDNRFNIALTGRQLGKSVTSKTNMLRNGVKTEIHKLVPHGLRNTVVRVLEEWLLKLARVS